MGMTGEQLTTLRAGTVIGGRYEVVRHLGAGSMGLVYACRHRELGNMVAVKVLFAEVANDPVAAKRFNNEIFASYGVTHPNVVRAYEYIREGGVLAYAMEYVDGGALADRLDKGRPLMAVSEIVKLLAQMCLGVQAIHDAGIVHRDLKPENILLTKDGQVKIADFGIARTDAGPRLTEHGGVVGTIEYVSPEYMKNSHVDWRSDLYALGVLAYEMLTGEPPFSGESVYAKLTKRLTTDPTPPSVRRAECSPELDRIVLKAMSRDPEARYQSAAEIFYDLEALSPERLNEERASLRLNRGASGTYQGPVLRDESAQVSSGKVLVSSPPVAAPAVDSPAKEQPPETMVLRGGGYATPRHPNVEFEDPAPTPRAERVLIGGGEIEWKARRAPGLAVSRSSIDGERMRELSTLSESTSAGVFASLLLLGIAFAVSFGIGFLVLRHYLPDIFMGDSWGWLDSAARVLERFLADISRRLR